MKSFKVLIGDPGKTNDPFGVIGLEASWPEKIIYTKHTKQFIKAPYNIVANHFAKLHKKINFDMILIEKNFDYDNISKAFSHLPITYVTTSGGLSEKTRENSLTIDKPYMINWLKEQYKNHKIVHSKQLSQDTAELLNQRHQIVGITGPSGHTSYKAQRNRHDDLFMGQLIGCNAIRLWWKTQINNLK